MTVPGYWMNETSGVLAPIVEKYLNGALLDDEEVATMRVYLRQWINADAFVGAAALRASIENVTTTAGLREWLDDALDIGIDPL